MGRIYIDVTAVSCFQALELCSFEVSPTQVYDIDIFIIILYPLIFQAFSLLLCFV